jgi:hypothetical protein
VIRSGGRSRELISTTAVVELIRGLLASLREQLERERERESEQWQWVAVDLEAAGAGVGAGAGVAGGGAAAGATVPVCEPCTRSLRVSGGSRQHRREAVPYVT